jgi:hypothetical protein
MLPRLISEIDFKNTKVIVQYWDPFTWWAREHNLTNLTRKRTLECYRIIDNRADKILVPSEGMADAIDSGMKADVLANRKINTLFIPVHDLPSEQDIPKDILIKMSQYDVKIVFAGSLYALFEFGLLIKALDSIAWKDKDKKIGLFAIGSTLIPEEFERSHVHKIPRVSESRADSILMAADLLFLPYPLNSADIAKQSFPSKLSTYVGIEQPLLVIASANSSLVEFLKSHGWERGIVSNASVTNLVGELRYLLTKNGAATSRELVGNLKREALSASTFQKTLFDVFNLEEKKRFTQEITVFLCEPANDRWTKINMVSHRIISWVPRSFAYRILGRIVRGPRKLIRKIRSSNGSLIFKPTEVPFAI